MKKRACDLWRTPGSMGQAGSAAVEAIVMIVPRQVGIRLVNPRANSLESCPSLVRALPSGNICTMSLWKLPLFPALIFISIRSSCLILFLLYSESEYNDHLSEMTPLVGNAEEVAPSPPSYGVVDSHLHPLQRIPSGDSLSVNSVRALPGMIIRCHSINVQTGGRGAGTCAIRQSSTKVVSGCHSQLYSWIRKLYSKYISLMNL